MRKRLGIKRPASGRSVSTGREGGFCAMIRQMSESQTIIDDQSDALPDEGADDLLFNLTLLNGLVAAVDAGLIGRSIGQCFGIGMAVVLVVMPLILSASWLVLRPFDRQHLHARLANVILSVTLVCGGAVGAMIALGY